MYINQCFTIFFYVIMYVCVLVGDNLHVNIYWFYDYVTLINTYIDIYIDIYTLFFVIMNRDFAFKNFISQINLSYNVFLSIKTWIWQDIKENIIHLKYGDCILLLMLSFIIF